jgi:hypothetical protein
MWDLTIVQDRDRESLPFSRTPKLRTSQIAQFVEEAGIMPEAGPRMHVEQLLDTSGLLLKCVIRCRFGTVSPGARVVMAGADGTCEERPSASVLKIWKYGKEVDMVDAPHGAMIELGGELVGSVTQGVTLCVLK